MAYTRRTWEDGNTKLIAANFNAMEAGIAAASATADKAVADLAQAKEELSAKIASETAFKAVHETRMGNIETDIANNVKTSINEHTVAENPHKITAESLNAYTKGEVDQLISENTGAIISCGTTDPDSQTTGNFYFKYTP